MKSTAKLIKKMSDIEIYDVTELVTSNTIDITTARLRACGRMASLAISGTLNSAVSAGSSLQLCSIDESIRPAGNAAATVGDNGPAFIAANTGAVNARPINAMAKNASVYFLSTYMMQAPFIGGVLRRSIFKACSHLQRQEVAA